MAYRLFKWLIVVVLVYLLVTYPVQIFGKLSELIRPVIIEQSQTLLEENRNSINKNLNIFFKNIKSILDENLSDTSIPLPSPQAEVVKPSQTKVSPIKTTTPVKKTAPI
jgi:hypothetical protein